MTVQPVTAHSPPCRLSWVVGSTQTQIIISLSLPHFLTPSTTCSAVCSCTIITLCIYQFMSICLSVVLASPSCRCSQAAAYCCQPAHCCVPDEGEAHSWPLSHVQGQNGERPAHWRRWSSGQSCQRGRWRRWSLQSVTLRYLSQQTSG